MEYTRCIAGKTYLRWLLLLVISLSSAKIIHMLILRGLYFIHGAHVADTQLYWTVGRAILNGFVPYIDIYENKPPGIFLLSAVSLHIFHDGTLGFLFNAGVLWSIPILFSFLLFRKMQGGWRGGAVSWIIFGYFFLMSTALITFSSVVAGPWQTEYYGGFFAILYAFLLWVRQRRWTYVDTIVSAMLMVFSMGFKEPFFFSFLGVALCFLRDRRSFFQMFLVPALLSAIIGVLLLLLLGYTHGYVYVHLSAMLGHRVVQYAPLYLRPLYLSSILLNAWNTSPLFAVSILLLCMTALSFLVVQTRQFFRVRTLVILLSFFIAYVSVGIGGDFQAHHFAGMVPYYFALLLFVHDHLDVSSRVHIAVLSASSVLLSVMIFLTSLSFSTLSYAEQLDSLSSTDTRSQGVATAVDALLDACSIDRYFVMGEPIFYSWTEHTPWNFFLFGGIETIPRFGRVISKLDLESMGKAQIIFVPVEGYDFRPGNPSEQAVARAIATFLQTSFTTQRPTCARDLSVAPFLPLFRVHPGDTTPPIRL